MKKKQYGQLCGLCLAVCLLLLALALPQGAQAADVEVSTLDQLVAALNGPHNGETIRVTRAIGGEITPKEKAFPNSDGLSAAKINGACTLDLGGYVVTVKLLSSDDFIGVAEDGDLTVKNGELYVSGEDYHAGITSAGKLTLESVAVGGGDGLYLSPGSHTNIKTAELFGTEASGIACFGGSLRINHCMAAGEDYGIYFENVPETATVHLTEMICVGKHAAMAVVNGPALKTFIPEGVIVEVNGVATTLSNETELKGKVILGKASEFYLNIGAHLQMAKVISQPLPVGEPLGVRVVDVPKGKQVKDVLLNDAPITATKDADGVYHFKMPNKDSVLTVTFADGPSTPDPGQTPSKDLLTSLFKIGDKRVEINNKGVQGSVTMDVAPYIKNGRTMLPVRFVGQSLNMKVDFDANTRNVTVKGPARSITLNLDSDQATVDGKSHKLQSKPENAAGRTMLPIGEIADLIGLSRKPEPHPTGNLHWDDASRTVKISVPAV